MSAEPKYMDEIRYSYLVGSFRRASTGNYAASSPESAFEASVQSLFLQSQASLHNHEYILALDALRELMALILRTVHPQMPVDPNFLRHFVFPMDVALVDVLANRTALTLKAAPVTQYHFPATVVSQTSALPAAVAAKVAAVSSSGLQITSFHRAVSQQVATALVDAGNQDWPAALNGFKAALAAVPASETLVRGSLLHDMAVLSEKAGDKPGAAQLGRQSVDALGTAQRKDLQVVALDTVVGIAQRAGQADVAAQLSQQATTIRAANNVHAVTAGTFAIGELQPLGLQTFSFATGIDATVRPRAASAFAASGALAGAGTAVLQPTAVNAPVAAIAGATANVDAPTLMGLSIFGEQAVERTVAKTFTMQGATASASIVLNDTAGANAKQFLDTVSKTRDLDLLTKYFLDPVQMVAYLPHMYFFVIPMAMGDCLAGLGDLEQAAAQYQSVLPYPFINQNLEIVRLWTRLAQVRLDIADAAYRTARDDAGRYPAVRALYETIVTLDRKVPAGSALYADPKFAALRARVAAFLAAADPVAHDDNPAVTSIVVQALTKLQQLKQGLNFFGFGPDYAPPFSFEYLQNTARYFAQQASQIEQRYIQFKSQAENEQLRRDELGQQADVAAQSVILEQRGADEAQTGVDVATASQSYARRQVTNAAQATQDFQENRWELLELAEAEAWASASAVDHDDEVKLTWTGSYYNSSHKPRNEVLKDLAYQRARLSQDLEERKLVREIVAAQDYKAVADRQVDQANARVAVADQRVVVAQLRQKHAEHNRDFLDMREFGSQLWYDLAQQAERLKQRYLDMATEMAFLMERAYNAETERGLHVIRYDYDHTASGNLMGADLLAVDIDYFTYDHVTTTKTKKLPVKKAISLADAYPTQFQSLKATGICFFETALEDFDREYPGLYLAKIRNVELLFVGISQATSIAGTLRNVGVSRFRDSSGAIAARLYPADVLMLSQYDIRQDALAFRFSPNDLRLFENNGVATSWQLELPPSANDFDFADILDVHLVLYYDGFFDLGLETKIKATLPAKGTASRAFSMKMSFPDELFYLKSQGQAELAFDELMFPHSQKEPARSATTLKVTGTAEATAGLKLRLSAASLGAAPMTLTLDVAGEAGDAAAGSPLASLRGKTMLDTLTVAIVAEDNPGLVHDGALDLSGIDDVLIFSEYGFAYR